ncbi:MAG: ferrous iron transport protein B [Clostridia bacterium]|nr:ferrous iron transport protein B [Clostridia bacterium]
MTLGELPVGKSAVITSVGGEGALRGHFLNMGLIPGAEVTVIKYAPLGDPMEVRVHGYELTLRRHDAEKILTEETNESERGVREGGILWSSCVKCPGNCRKCTRAAEEPLPEGTVLTFALAGNQNSGKTTLFNALTGADQHVGNFPGVTVEEKSGMIRGYPETLVTDLPGIYSLSPYSNEEIISRDSILSQKPTGIINIVAATNLERSLNLTLQLLTLDIPTVLVLNMMDEVRGSGGRIDFRAMEELLGIPVVPISAAKNEGVDELVRRAIHAARFREKPGRRDLDGGAADRALCTVAELIGARAEAANIPVRFAADKVAEGDKQITEALCLSESEKQAVERVLLRMEKECSLDRAAAVADMRFAFVRAVCEKTVVRPKESREHRRSSVADRILTGKFTAIPIFVGIMALVFYLTFHVIGAWLQELLETGIGWLGGKADALLTSWGAGDILRSLVTDGIFAGVGSVLSFIPVILTLFFFLSLLEDSGYMARVAFVMDKLLCGIGLSGRSIVPMLIGFGCTVPGVMACRTLPAARDRKMTVLLLPFMSCSAKLPIYGFFINAFFPEQSGLIMAGIYFLGIVIGVFAAWLFKDTLFKGEAVPFVMELPPYRLPGVKNVWRLLWNKAKDFLERAFTVILLATCMVWLLESFDFCLSAVSDPSESMLAALEGFITPVFKPLGFGDWRVVTALFAGVLAKESVVSTLAVLIGGYSLTSVLSPLGAMSLLVFALLYTPCVAAVASVRRELGGCYAAWVVIGQSLLAWFCAFLCHAIGAFCGMV